jgi:hypothetical protein
MMLNLQGYRFSVLNRDGKKHMDADAISRLLRFDTLGDIHLLEVGTPCRTMDKGLEISLIRKIMLDREFLDPGRDLDPPPLPPAKTRRGYTSPNTPDPALDTKDDPDTINLPQNPVVYDLLDELLTQAGAYLTSNFTAPEDEGQDVLYQLNTHCHSGSQHAYRLPGQTPSTVETFSNTGLADNPHARQFRPRVRDANKLPIPPQEQPLTSSEQTLTPETAEDSITTPDPPDQATMEIPIQPQLPFPRKKQQLRHLLPPQTKSRPHHPRR